MCNRNIEKIRTSVEKGMEDRQKEKQRTGRRIKETNRRRNKITWSSLRSS
jgi:hypothetical protein